MAVLRLNLEERRGARGTELVEMVAGSAFLNVLQRWQLAPDDVVMIGDTIPADIAGAAAVGMRSILVEIAPRMDTLSSQACPDVIGRIMNLRDIPSVLAGIEA